MQKILIKSALERRKINRILELSHDINEIDIWSQSVDFKMGGNWFNVHLTIVKKSKIISVNFGKILKATSNNITYLILSIDFYHKSHKELNKCIKTLEYIKELLTNNNK